MTRPCRATARGLYRRIGLARQPSYTERQAMTAGERREHVLRIQQAQRDGPVLTVPREVKLKGPQ
jgi:hypothetical protein